ncbi:MAG: serine hydrolase [Pyrinomonadaceae bacterium]|nr:serine hydrolase [Pyrinomonadaceae bacterium]
MKRYFLRVNLLILLLVLPFAASAQTLESKLAEIDQYALKVMEDWNQPGMAIAIVKDGKTVFAKGYGVRQIGTNDKVDENTIFAIASNSKAFTTAGIAILIDEGKIGGWDDKVSKYLPEFRLYSPYVSDELTIRDLVSHRVGLDTFSGDLLWYETTYTDDEILRRLKFLKPVRGFRSGFGYQNLMFIAAGKIIEKVSGKSWGDFIKEKILAPLEMNRTTVTVKDLRDNAATPHNESLGSGLRALNRGNVDGAAAAAGLNSSVADLTKWIKLQLGRGESNGKRIFSEKNSWEMWQPAVLLPLSKAASEYMPTRHFNTYGLGWNLFDYQGKKIVTHGGGLDGMLSKTVLIPEENVGFVVLTNSEYPVYSIMQSKILDVFVDAPKRDWNAESKARAESSKKTESAGLAKMNAARIKDAPPGLPLKEYAGTYTGEFYGDVLVSEENGKLVLRFKPAPNFVADLEPWHFNTFRIKWRPSVSYDFPPGFVTFSIDKNGKTDELKIDQPNNDFWFYELQLNRQK